MLTGGECRALAALYDREEAFRSRVVMQRHGFGRGEYKYFRYPLPGAVESAAPGALPAARADRQSLAGAAGRARGGFPPSLAAYLERCHAAGQTRPTPLLLKYGPGDYNCLHQDLYGELVFPLQVTVLLSRSRARTSPAASSCSSSSARARSRGARSCRCGRARR